MLNGKEKTTEDYWNKHWKKTVSGKVITDNVITLVAHNRRLDILLKNTLKKGDKKILEIGCSPGRWLLYFYKEFGFKVYGVDYSEIGCKITEANLRRNHVKGKIIHETIFNTSFQNKYAEYFDIVYSMGVVEHFTDPHAVIDIHLKFLKKEGILIITMPNFGYGSLYLWLQKILKQEDITKHHNVKMMKIQNFKRYLKNFEKLEIKMLNYVGPINLAAVTWPFADSNLMYLLHGLNQVIGYLTFFLNSEIFSPTIVLIAKKF